MYSSKHRLKMKYRKVAVAFCEASAFFARSGRVWHPGLHIRNGKKRKNKTKTGDIGLEKTKDKARLRLPARASLWYIVSSAVARGVGVMGTPIFTRLLSAEEYGLFPLYNTWLSLFSAVFTLELGAGALTRALQRYENEEDKLISAALGLCLTLILGGGAIYLALPYPSKITGLDRGVGFIMILHIIFNTAVGLYTARERYRYSYRRLALINIGTAISVPLLSVGLIWLTQWQAQARIIASAAVSGIIAIPILNSVIKRSARLFDGGMWRYLLRLCLPLMPHYLSCAVIMRVGEISVERSFGVGALGRYAVAMSLGMSLTMISTGVLSALVPWVLRRIKAGQSDRIREIMPPLLAGMCLLCLLVLSVVPETLKIVTPPEYRDCLPAVYPLALSVLPMFVSSVLTGGLSYYERGGISSVPSVLAAAGTVALSLLLLPKTDYRMAGVFVLLAYTLMCVLNLIIFKRIAGFTPVSPRGLAQGFAVTLLYATLLFLLRGAFLSRLLLALPILPVLFVCARRGWRLIKEV